MEKQKFILITTTEIIEFANEAERNQFIADKELTEYELDFRVDDEPLAEA